VGLFQLSTMFPDNKLDYRQHMPTNIHTLVQYQELHLVKFE